VTEAQDLLGTARTIIDTNVYMTLGTVSEDGRPLVSPVYYAMADYRRFYWVSDPDATHSRNLAERPEASIVIFDSHAKPGEGQAVYMTATVEQLTGEDIAPGLEIYPGPAERGGGPLAPEELRAPAVYRLYRATVSEHSVLCPRDFGPCALHGRAVDHRVAVNP
jgi:hypothetical protein